MENASKALIISAEILIGVLLLTFLVFMLNSMDTFSQTVNSNIETKNVNEFNSQFETYNGRNNLTAQDVITIGNLARNYNNTEEGQETKNKIIVYLQGTESKYANVHTLNDEQTYEFIEKYSVENKATFECQITAYSENTKKVNRIQLKMLK